jgi:hypothetical protein
MREFYSEGGTKWVCVLRDDQSAFVAIRAGEHGQWELSFRRWVTDDKGETKLHIKPMGRYDDLYKAQDAVGLHIDRARSIYYSSSSPSSINTSDMVASSSATISLSE